MRNSLLVTARTATMAAPATAALAHMTNQSGRSGDRLPGATCRGASSSTQGMDKKAAVVGATWATADRAPRGEVPCCSRTCAMRHGTDFHWKPERSSMPCILQRSSLVSVLTMSVYAKHDNETAVFWVRILQKMKLERAFVTLYAGL